MAVGDDGRSRLLDLVALLALTAGLAALRLPARYVQVHDSMQVFQVFHYLYSSVLFLNELPQWLPYGAHGMPLDAWASFCLTPPCYLVAGIGKLFGVTDALLLFKLAIAL